MNLRAVILSVSLACVSSGLLAQDAAGEPPRRAMNRFGQGPSGHEIEEASQFMQQNAPNRWQLIQSLPEDGAFKRGVIGFMVARYKSLQAMKEEDPKLYEIKLAQLRSEDELYGLVVPAHSAEERDKLRPELALAVRRMVELNIAEREHRIERLRSSLAAEEQRLSNDRNMIDKAVALKVDTLVSEGTAALRRDILPRAAMRREGRPSSQPARRE